MPNNILLPQTFLALESIQLGRLVLNTTEPQSDFLDLGGIDSDDVTITPKHHFLGQESITNTNEFGGGLVHLLSLTRSKRKNIETQITTERVTTYLLNNSEQWFREAVQQEDIRMWIENADRNGGDIYLVTGYHTLLDARVYEGGTQDHTVAGNVALPIAEVLTATGVMVPFGEAVDPSATAARQTLQASQQSFTAPGEQVCTVQYRKVRFKWYSRGELHEKPLGPNKWKSYLTFRGQDEDFVEVDLQDDLELEADYTIDTIDGENFLLSDTQ